MYIYYRSLPLNSHIIPQFGYTCWGVGVSLNRRKVEVKWFGEPITRRFQLYRHIQRKTSGKQSGSRVEMGGTHKNIRRDRVADSFYGLLPEHVDCLKSTIMAII